MTSKHLIIIGNNLQRLQHYFYQIPFSLFLILLTQMMEVYLGASLNMHGLTSEFLFPTPYVATAFWR